MSETFESLMNAGLEASQRNDAEAAVLAWARAAQAEPSSPIPHFLSGAEYAQAGQIAEAEAAYASAVLLSPGFEVARYQLGLLQFTSGRAALAQVTWQPLFALPDGHHLRSFVFGFAALARDEFDTALARFAAGMQANRDNPPMNADVAKVVAAIEALPTAVQHATSRHAGEEGHVLLAGYREQGVLR